MCRTSAPPRRDIYELTQTLPTVPTKSAAEQGGFLVPKTKAPRIGSTAWLQQRDNAIAVFNGGYDVDGTRLNIGNAEPWTVITPDGAWSHFWTHAEALAYAFNPTKETP